MKEITGQDAITKVRELIKEIDIGMLVTRGEDVPLRARPMSCNGDIEPDGTLYFFTRQDSRLVGEIADNPGVNLSFSSPEKNLYVSVSGMATLTDDRTLISKLWKPELKAWFAEGEDDPLILIIKVRMQEAEYWETKGSLISHTLNFALSLIGQSDNDATTEHGKVR